MAAKRKKNVQNAVHFTLYTLNGGPLPADYADNVEKLLERTLRDIEEVEGVRAVMSVNRS